MKLFVDIVGWIGALSILAAYGLLSFGKLPGHSRTYHLLNVVGATGLIINSGWNSAFPSAALNLIWMGIGLYGMARGPKAASAAARQGGSGAP
jgi:hypothetical protein